MKICKYLVGSGCLEMWFERNILYSRVSGPVGPELLDLFDEHTTESVQRLQLDVWGSVSISPSIHAATPHAFLQAVELTKKMSSMGCVAFAYILGSAVAIDQLKRLRDEVGFEEQLDEVLFDNLKEAELYIQHSITRYKQEKLVDKL